MIIEKLLDEKNLTESEKQIAHYLLEKSHYINQLTCEELGKVSFTSQSSVSRLCKKLGFITFREFLTSLMIERNEYFKTLNLRPLLLLIFIHHMKIPKLPFLLYILKQWLYKSFIR